MLLAGGGSNTGPSPASLRRPMAILSAPWDKTRIKGMKGKLDFYTWKGIPVVRRWPRTPRSHLSPYSIAQWPKFSVVSSSYKLQPPGVIDALRQMSDGSQASVRDEYIALNYAKVLIFEFASP